MYAIIISVIVSIISFILGFYVQKYFRKEQYRFEVFLERKRIYKKILKLLYKTDQLIEEDDKIKSQYYRRN